MRVLFRVAFVFEQQRNCDGLLPKLSREKQINVMLSQIVVNMRIL